MDHGEGFEVPIHRSLTEPLLIAGMPRGFALTFGSIMGAMVFGLHNLWIVPMGAIIYFIALLTTKADPCFFELLVSHLKEPRWYSV